MARKPRVEYPGALFHVICRGNQRQTIFHNDADRRLYLERLEQYRKRYRFTIYAYVLMSNHVHLLLETGNVPLSKIMQGLQFTYIHYFNRRRGALKTYSSSRCFDRTITEISFLRQLRLYGRFGAASMTSSKSISLLKALMRATLTRTLSPKRNFLP